MKMSMRSIIELNHDYTNKIREDPSEFVTLLTRAMNSGDHELWEMLEPFGVQFGIMAHHSDKRSCAGKYSTCEFG